MSGPGQRRLTVPQATVSQMQAQENSSRARTLSQPQTSSSTAPRALYHVQAGPALSTAVPASAAAQAHPQQLQTTVQYASSSPITYEDSYLNRYRAHAQRQQEYEYAIRAAQAQAHPQGHVQPRASPISPILTHPHIPFDDRLLDKVLNAISTPFNSQAETLAKIQSTLKTLTDSHSTLEKAVDSYKSSTEKHLRELVEASSTSHSMHQARLKALGKRTERVEALVMAGFDKGDKGSLLGMIESLQWGIGELVERAKDPGALGLVLDSQADVNTQALDGRDHTMLTPESEPILIDEDSPLDPITTPTSPTTNIQRRFVEKSISCDLDTVGSRPSPPLVRVSTQYEEKSISCDLLVHGSESPRLEVETQSTPAPDVEPTRLVADTSIDVPDISPYPTPPPPPQFLAPKQYTTVATDARPLSPLSPRHYDFENKDAVGKKAEAYDVLLAGLKQRLHEKGERMSEEGWSVIGEAEGEDEDEEAEEDSRDHEEEIDMLVDEEEDEGMNAKVVGTMNNDGPERDKSAPTVEINNEESLASPIVRRYVDDFIESESKLATTHDDENGDNMEDEEVQSPSPPGVLAAADISSMNSRSSSSEGSMSKTCREEDEEGDVVAPPSKPAVPGPPDYDTFFKDLEARKKAREVGALPSPTPSASLSFSPQPSISAESSTMTLKRDVISESSPAKVPTPPLAPEFATAHTKTTIAATSLEATAAGSLTTNGAPMTPISMPHSNLAKPGPGQVSASPTKAKGVDNANEVSPTNSSDFNLNSDASEAAVSRLVMDGTDRDHVSGSDSGELEEQDEQDGGSPEEMHASPPGMDTIAARGDMDTDMDSSADVPFDLNALEEMELEYVASPPRPATAGVLSSTHSSYRDSQVSHVSSWGSSSKAAATAGRTPLFIPSPSTEESQSPSPADAPSAKDKQTASHGSTSTLKMKAVSLSTTPSPTKARVGAEASTPIERRSGMTVGKTPSTIFTTPYKDLKKAASMSGCVSRSPVSVLSINSSSPLEKERVKKALPGFGKGLTTAPSISTPPRPSSSKTPMRAQMSVSKNSAKSKEPIYIMSRSASPLSVLTVSDDAESDDESLFGKTPKGEEKEKVTLKKEDKEKEKMKSQSNVSRTDGGRVGIPAASGSERTGSGATTNPIPKAIKKIDLLAKIKAKDTSAARTRVRKRKANPEPEMREPPLKRARKRAVLDSSDDEDVQDAVTTSDIGTSRKRPRDEENGAKEGLQVKREKIAAGGGSSRSQSSGSVRGVPHSNSGKGKGKEKATEDKDDKEFHPSHSHSTDSEVKDEKKKLRPRSTQQAPQQQRQPPKSASWPKRSGSGDRKFDYQFIECEKCEIWYHYGCAGITDPNDPILKMNEPFLCPPCKGGGANPLIPSDSNKACARPDCDESEKRPDEYFMTAILGRYTKVVGGSGRKYMWLVKWDGYSVKHCTWEEESGMSDPQIFIDHFHKKALKEGKDPDEDPNATILLKEALKGGCKEPTD